LGYIENSFLLHRADRYNISGKDTIAGNCKYYANDLSFRNYLYPGFNSGIGYQLENLIYLQLRQAGYNVYVGVVHNKEIDFVAKKVDRFIYLQCAYLLSDAKIIKREYAPLELIKDNYEKFVVFLDDIEMPSKNGIKHTQIWKLEKFI
jgi:predicted AAA+ superfamily ATPase